ncbi:MAG TPA: poly-gamma-glutamate synthase PgsB [Gemmatimonadales bacterium]|nr:poly-gamma-glutamate synthase PgsB [Gemmatimonadales bacterium]
MFGMLALSAGLLAAGVVEGVRHRAALEAVPIRIHVNGTRGKSSVTRLITASLQAGSVRTLGKVTGTVHRWLLPDGTEAETARRSGPARIHEQIAAVRRAAALGCTALVAECMAVQPELQWVSEHRILHSTIGVITNARLDHEGAMGPRPGIIARTLGNTIPDRGLLVCGEAGLAEVLEPAARAAGTRVVVAGSVPLAAIPAELRGVLAWHHPANLGTALAVAEALGIDAQAAWQGMASAPPDPGTAVFALVRAAAGRTAVVLDATAANDPVSLEIVMAGMRHLLGEGGEVHIVYHHRPDRLDRLARFGRSLAEMPASSLWCSGPSAGAAYLVRATGRAVTGVRTPAEALDRLGARRDGGGAPEPAPAGGDLIVVCGNTRGAGPWRRAFGPWRPVPLREEGIA